jgi:metallopeptidase MepB
MFLENFCWLKDELREMSCHYTRLGNPRYVSAWQARNPGASLPPEKIPEHMLDDLIASRYIGSGTMQAYQL